MGIRFRKSVKLPGGLRVNFSKKGIGCSWGVKGYRKTKMANGRSKTTYSIPGTGLSYVKETRAKSQQTVNSAQQKNKTVKRSVLNSWWYLLVAIFMIITGIYGIRTGDAPVLASVIIAGAILMLVLRFLALYRTGKGR